MTDNNLKMITINGQKYNNNITDLDLSYIYLTELPKEIGKLSQLTDLNLSHNKLTELPKEIGNLTQLTELYLDNNELTELPKEIGNLTQLTYLNLKDNKLTELPKEIGNLTQLTKLYLSNTNLTELPLEIINLRILRNFKYYSNPIENLLNPIISRFIARIESNNGITGTIYNDTQNVHSSSIQQSIKDSIFNLMKNYNNDYQLNYLSNPILTQTTKEALIEYSNCTEIHSIMEITFEELLKAVLIEIDTLENKDEIFEILNQEMADSICKCFTGRISRLVNCLSSFSDKVSIQISTNEEISNIIIVLQNKITDIDELKKAIEMEMTERGYDEATINEWVLYVE